MSKKWTAADLVDLHGRTILVTGASNGLGLETTRRLAGRGAHVVMAVRSPARGRDAARTISGSTEVRELDLASLASVRAFAADWTGDLDVLVNNAGISLVPEQTSPDGFELHMATNFFGPFALTNLLLPHVTDRVVTLSSQLHRTGKLRLDDIDSTGRHYDAAAAYSNSKLADTVFALELHRRLAGAGSRIRSIVAHPGIARTSLVDHAGGLAGSINKLGPLLNDVEHGALPTLFAATEDVPSGAYIGPDGPLGIKGYPKAGKPSSTARDPKLGEQLWQLAVARTNVPSFDSQAGAGTVS